MQARKLREKSLHPTPAKLLRGLHQPETGRPFVLVVRLQKWIMVNFFPFCFLYCCFLSSRKTSPGYESLRKDQAKARRYARLHVMPVSRCHGRVSFPTTLDLSLRLVKFESISPTPSPCHRLRTSSQLCY